MIRFKTLFLVTVIFAGWQCSSPQKQEVAPSGKLNGIYRLNYPTGELYVEANYKDSLPDGLTKIFFKNGKVFEETEYRRGVKHGLSTTFYESGLKSSETQYDSGRMHGTKRKYRKDGSMAFEASYWYDRPCVGLKEFYVGGDPVNFPKIVIKPQNKLLSDQSYVLELRMSDGSKSVQFFKGKLAESKYIPTDADVLQSKDGVGKLVYFVERGGFVMEDVNIIARVKTDLGNYYITQLPYRVSIEHY